jgi:hypothetical protein
MRMLASAQTIVDLKPIEGADRIEQATVLGWTCVVSKGKHKIGERVIYLEIDSVLPDDLLVTAGLWDEAKGKGVLGKKAGNVLTTRKFKGCLAQGLVLPLSVLGNFDAILLAENTDLTTALKITKYERYVEADNIPGQPNRKRSWQYKLAQKFKPTVFFLSKYIPWFEKFIGNGGPFPEYITKTDQTRIQNLTPEWHMLSEFDYEVTEKMEGTSSTYFYNKGDYGMCSRNLRLSNNDQKHFGQIQKKYDIFKKLKKAKLNIAIQGEIIGPAIQGNYYKLTELQLKIFDIYLIDEQRYALPFERLKIVEQLDLKDLHVHVFQFANNWTHGKTIQEILELADAKSVINPKVDREGLVFKSLKTQRSFKAISNSYLLKQE